MVILRILQQSTNKVLYPCLCASLALAYDSIVIAADPDNDDAKRGLAEVYEILGETRKALNLVNQGVWRLNLPLEVITSYLLNSDRCAWEARGKAWQAECSGQSSERPRGIVVRRNPILETDQGV